MTDRILTRSRWRPRWRGVVGAAAASACVVVAATPRVGVAQVGGFLRCPAPFMSGTDSRTATPSFTGGPGLFEVPSATAMPDGDVSVAFNRAKLLNPEVPLQWQNNGFLSVTFLPGITLTGRGSVRHSGTARDIFFRDVSANIQGQLFNERGWRPAVALGMHDVNGANAIFPAKYAVATKQFAGRVRVTAGWGTGVSLLDGPFGGIEVAPCPWLTLIAENDGRQRSAGLRLDLLASLGSRVGVRPSVDIAWLGDQGVVTGFGVRLATGPAQNHRPLPAAGTRPVVRAERTPAAPIVERVAVAVRDALVAAGLENVRVLPVTDGLLDVQYENRRWVLDDLDGLGVALGVVAAHASSDVQRVRITIRKVDIPVLAVTTGLAPWRAYLEDPSRERDFIAQLTAAAPPAGSAPIEGAPTNQSRFRLDLTARPRVETVLMSEISAFETRTALLPEFIAQLGPGLTLTGRRSIVLGQSDEFIREIAEPGADRLLLHAATRLPARIVPRGAMGIAQLSVGRLGHRQVGAHWDQVVELRGGRWSAGVSGAVYGDAASRIKKSYGYGTLRWRLPEREIAATITAGRFRFGDVGTVAEVARRLGLVEVGFLLQATDLSSAAGIRLTVPLSPRRQLRPRAVRVVLPDYFEHVEDVTVFEPIPVMRTDVARSVDIGHSVARAYLGRGWLSEASIRTRAWALRNAALREGW